MTHYVYKWHIEHLDERTNEYISQMLDTATQLHVDKLCADGKTHTLWDCGTDYLKIEALRVSGFPLRYRIYREGHDGDIVLYQKRKKELDPGIFKKK